MNWSSTLNAIQAVLKSTLKPVYNCTCDLRKSWHSNELWGHQVDDLNLDVICRFKITSDLPQIAWYHIINWFHLPNCSEVFIIIVTLFTFVHFHSAKLTNLLNYMWNEKSFLVHIYRWSCSWVGSQDALHCICQI